MASSARIARSIHPRRLPTPYITFALSSQSLRNISPAQGFPSHSPRTRDFSTSIPKMADNLLALVKERRTYYQLSNESVISDDRIHEIIQKVILHTPSSFNSQSTRALILLGDEHQKLWEEIVKPAVKAVAPAEAWEGSNKRLSGFAAAYGSVRMGSP